MLTITTRQAVHQFGKFAKMANGGKRILVTHAGQPLIVLQPPPKVKKKLTPLQWPDFAAYWQKHFPVEGIAGPTATELLAQDKEDRF